MSVALWRKAKRNTKQPTGLLIYVSGPAVAQDLWWPKGLLDCSFYLSAKSWIQFWLLSQRCASSRSIVASAAITVVIGPVALVGEGRWRSVIAVMVIYSRFYWFWSVWIIKASLWYLCKAKLKHNIKSTTIFWNKYITKNNIIILFNAYF